MIIIAYELGLNTHERTVKVHSYKLRELEHINFVYLSGVA